MEPLKGREEGGRGTYVDADGLTFIIDLDDGSTSFGDFSLVLWPKAAHDFNIVTAHGERNGVYVRMKKKEMGKERKGKKEGKGKRGRGTRDGKRKGKRG